MRYLYGDSTPAPLQFNFLATVEELVVCAAAVILIDHELRGLENGAAQAALTRGKALESLDRYHRTIMQSLRETSSRSLEPHVLGYADGLGGHAAQYVEEVRVATQALNERELGGVRLESERRRQVLRQAVDRFFKFARLPTLETRISMGLATAKEPQYEGSCTLVIPGGIVASYTLAPANLPEWRQPRKVSEFARDVDLMVGGRKSWFKKTVERELVHLDDMIVSGFDLSDEAAEIRMRRKPDQRDSLHFSVKRIDAGVYAQVHFPDDPETEQALPSGVQPTDAAQLERLWQLLKAGSANALDQRDRVATIHLDLEDVFESHREVELMDRIIRLLGPQVTEIERRSPSPHELSLKFESDSGERKEIYLKKIELLKKLEPLPLDARMKFAPLALWHEEHLSNISIIVEA